MVCNDLPAETELTEWFKEGRRKFDWNRFPKQGFKKTRSLIKISSKLSKLYFFQILTLYK